MSISANAQSPLTLDSDVPVPVVNSRAAVVMDAATGTLLYFKNPDEEIPPASLTKLMTIHLALTEVKKGRLSLFTPINPPFESWHVNQPPRSSLMFLNEGQTTNLHEIILGLAVPSGNDAAIAAALQVAPTVRDFVNMMNLEAAALGLEKTHFDEPSGISEYNMTTAREFAQFCRFYINTHPETLKEYHSVKDFAYPKAENVPEAFRRRPGTIGPQPNNNTLLGVVEGVDGLKTGYIDESGYNIALTAQRGEDRFIAVILGAARSTVRTEDGTRLINWVFENYKTVRPPAPEIEKAKVWKGKADYVSLAPAMPLEFTSRTNRADVLLTRTELNGTLVAPLPAGTTVGELIYSDNSGELLRVPLVTVEEIAEGGFFKRLFDSITMFFRQL